MDASQRFRVARELGLAPNDGRGLIERDQHTHAITARLDGLTSRCGAGPVVRELPGLFDSPDPLARPHCAGLVTREFG